jgi:c(7)-type cytochrome triheme protein
MTVMQKTSGGQSHPESVNAPRASRVRRLCSLAFVAVACVGFALVFIKDYRAAAQSQRQPSARETLSAAQEPGRDFSKFTHTNPVHSRLPCLLCHRRDTNSPRPAVPGASGHMPCAGCHAQQFTDPSSPICTICHTDAQSGAMKPFPPLRTFGVRFDHATHTRQNLRQGCATCHKPDRRGVALSIPSGAVGHTTCFQCHTPQAEAGGRDISSCGTCHRIGGYSRTPQNAPAYRASFSHSAHTARGLACAECHQVRAGAAQRRQVTAPAPLMHHASPGALSCISCHNDKRAFGVENFKNCTRCHRGNEWHF